MPFCIKASSYDETKHTKISGPTAGGCDSCLTIGGAGGFTSSSGFLIQLSGYLDVGGSVVAYVGSTGDTMTVPPGYDRAVYVDGSGNVTVESVVAGQVLTFRSDIVLGTVPKGACCYLYEGRKVCRDADSGGWSGTEFECVQLFGGEWHQDTACTQIFCAKGACCAVDGSCADEVYQNLCLDGGLFHSGKKCSEVNCANSSSSSSSSSSSKFVCPPWKWRECVDYGWDDLNYETCRCVCNPGRAYNEEGGFCTDKGACVYELPNGVDTCEYVTMEECISRSGGSKIIRWRHAEFCEELDYEGACCVEPSGAPKTCSVESQSICELISLGTWHKGKSCKEIECSKGACCFLDYSGLHDCQDDVTGPYCTNNLNGDAWEANATCRQMDCIESACCTQYPEKPDKYFCFEAGPRTGYSAEDCENPDGLKGVWYKHKSCREAACEEWACCYSENGFKVCDTKTEKECEDVLGGEWFEGSECEEVACEKGACCSDLVPCRDDVYTQECLLGVFHKDKKCSEVCENRWSCTGPESCKLDPLGPYLSLDACLDGAAADCEGVVPSSSSSSSRSLTCIERFEKLCSGILLPPKGTANFNPETCECCPQYHEWDYEGEECRCWLTDNICSSGPYNSMSIKGLRTVSGSVADTENCACVCPQGKKECTRESGADYYGNAAVCVSECGSPKYLNNECECVCIVDLGCVAPKVANEDCTECVCPSSSSSECKSPKIPNENCECVCPPGSPFCVGPKILSDNCQCICPKNSSTSECLYPKELDENCECVCPPVPGCELPKFVNENCECVCPEGKTPCQSGECCDDLTSYCSQGICCLNDFQYCEDYSDPSNPRIGCHYKCTPPKVMRSGPKWINPDCGCECPPESPTCNSNQRQNDQCECECRPSAKGACDDLGGVLDADCNCTTTTTTEAPPTSTTTTEAPTTTTTTVSCYYCDGAGQCIYSAGCSQGYPTLEECQANC